MSKKFTFQVIARLEAGIWSFFVTIYEYEIKLVLNECWKPKLETKFMSSLN